MHVLDDWTFFFHQKKKKMIMKDNNHKSNSISMLVCFFLQNHEQKQKVQKLKRKKGGIKSILWANTTKTTNTSQTVHFANSSFACKMPATCNVIQLKTEQNEKISDKLNHLLLFMFRMRECATWGWRKKKPNFFRVA